MNQKVKERDFFKRPKKKKKNPHGEAKINKWLGKTKTNITNNEPEKEREFFLKPSRKKYIKKG